MAWPGTRSHGPQAPGPRAAIPRTPEGAGEWDTWAPLTWGSFLFTEHTPQALPWSGDWTHPACAGWDVWSGVSPASGPAPPSLGPAPPGLGPAPFAGSGEVAGQLYPTSEDGATSWSPAPAAASSTSWDCPIGLDSSTYWGKGLPGERPADYTTSWGGPARSDYPNSWESGLDTDCTTSSKEYQSSDLTSSSELSRQSDRATLTRDSKTKYRGERSVRLSWEGAKPQSSGAELRLLKGRNRENAVRRQGLINFRYLRARE